MAEFQCQICKLEYAEKKLADECYKWCCTHDSCSFNIAKQAINKDEVGRKPLDDERFSSN